MPHGGVRHPVLFGETPLAGELGCDLALGDPPLDVVRNLDIGILSPKGINRPSRHMIAQLAHLAGLARLPNLTIQVVPNVAHAGLLGGFAVAERTAYVETAVAGQVFEDADIIADLLTRFDTLRNEAFRGSESLTLIERMCEEWKATGVKAVTQATTAGSA